MNDARAIMPVAGAIVLLALWLGAAVVVAGVVAPAAFAVLPSRTLAGALVGRVLPVLFWSGAAVGVLAAVLARAVPDGRMRLACMLAATVACLSAQLVVAPRIEAIRRSVDGPIDALAREDARRIAFGRLHGASVALLGAAALAATAALLLTVTHLTREH
jgi:hypothetical protein